jgi:Uncharacterised nucleotidyltransferase
MADSTTSRREWHAGRRWMPGAAAPPERELALLLAGTTALRARMRPRAARLARAADVAALEAFLQRDGLFALIGQRMRESVASELPDAFWRRLDEHAARARRVGIGQQLLTVRLLGALELAGIRALPLKGPLLAERLHGAAGARVSADVDLLVSAADLAPAVEVVLGLGYRRLAHDAAGGERPALHERLVHDSGLPDVELHWRVHWYEERFSAELLAHARMTDAGWLVPRPVDELALLLLLYARDGFAGLRLACDVATWWDRYGSELEPGALAQIAAGHPPLAGALATAALLAERLVGLPAARVLGPDALGHASAAALRLANWPLRGAEQQISANVSLVDWLLAPRGQRRALVRRHLLLSRRELLARWPLARAGRASLARRRALHALRVLGRYAVAGGSLLRRRAWAPLPACLRAPDGA